MNSGIARILSAARAARARDRVRSLALYRDGERAARSAGETDALIFALRHIADLELELGHAPAARLAAHEATELAEEAQAPALERANCLRLAALASEACGQADAALAAWHHARELYQEAGVADGVNECRERLG